MKQKFQSFKELSIQTGDYLKSLPKHPVLPISSMPKLNKLLWGLGRGRILIIAGRTAMGKSALISQVAWDLAKNGSKVLYLNLEMPNNQVFLRCFSRNYKINNEELLHGNIDLYLDKYQLFCDDCKQLPLRISDCLGSTWEEIDQLFANMPEKPDVIVVDHINHLKSNGNNDKTIIDDYLTNIHAISRKYNITVIIGAQINRLAGNQTNPFPELHHLKGSGRLEEIADMVWLLFWAYYYNRQKEINDYNIIVAKNRYGRTLLYDCNFYPQYSLFTDKNETNNHKDMDQTNEERWSD